MKRPVDAEEVVTYSKRIKTREAASVRKQDSNGIKINKYINTGSKAKIAAKLSFDHEKVQTCANKIVFELSDLIKTLQYTSHSDSNTKIV